MSNNTILASSIPIPLQAVDPQSGAVILRLRLINGVPRLELLAVGGKVVASLGAISDDPRDGVSVSVSDPHTEHACAWLKASAENSGVVARDAHASEVGLEVVAGPALSLVQEGKQVLFAGSQAEVGGYVDVYNHRGKRPVRISRGGLAYPERKREAAS